MTERFAKVAFANNINGARIDGQFIADTGPTWMVKPEGKPVQVLKKSEWTSIPANNGGFDDIFGAFFGGRR